MKFPVPLFYFPGKTGIRNRRFSRRPICLPTKNAFRSVVDSLEPLKIIFSDFGIPENAKKVFSFSVLTRSVLFNFRILNFQKFSSFSLLFVFSETDFLHPISNSLELTLEMCNLDLLIYHISCGQHVRYQLRERFSHVGEEWCNNCWKRACGPLPRRERLDCQLGLQTERDGMLGMRTRGCSGRTV